MLWICRLFSAGFFGDVPAFFFASRLLWRCAGFFEKPAKLEKAGTLKQRRDLFPECKSI